MNNSLFFNKVISYLAELNKRKQNLLVENGWISPEEENRIIHILHELGCIAYQGVHIKITKKGLKILLNQKVGKIEDIYNEKTRQLLISK